MTSLKRIGDKLRLDPSNPLGQGSAGTMVYKGFYRTHSLLGAVYPPTTYYIGDTEVAIKRLQKNAYVNSLLIEREVLELMRNANSHPNILRFICSEEDINFIYLVTELCIGTLEDYVTDEYSCLLPFGSDREVLYQITRGLAHLHSLKIVHRDIKPNNILIYEPLFKPFILQKPMMKLADFGISKILTAGDKFKNTSSTNPTGTRGWISPEQYGSSHFGFEVDIFALGCIFGYTLSEENKHPFGEDVDQRVRRIINKEVMVLVKADLKSPYCEDDVAFNLIKSMLDMNCPTNRPNVEAVLNNSFFKDHLVEMNSPQYWYTTVFYFFSVLCVTSILVFALIAIFLFYHFVTFWNYMFQ